jgi:hypothetical protein
LSGSFEKRLYLGHRTFELAGQRRFRIGKPQGYVYDYVYDDEGGTAPASAIPPKPSM